MKIQQVVILENGARLTLPPSPNFPNVARPNISKPNTKQLYDIGAEYEYNGKAWFYAKASGTVNPDMPVKTKNYQDITQVAATVAYAVYAEEISFHPNATDGPTIDSIFPKDYLKGGHLKVFNVTATARDFFVGITGNPAYDHADGASSVLTLQLDQPIPYALAVSDKIEAMASAYAAVIAGSDINQTVAGVPSCTATTGQWLWIQTWGPCWLPTQSTVGTAGIRGAAFRHDGSLSPALSTVSSLISSQYAGYTMSGASGAAQGAPFTYLQIAR